MALRIWPTRAEMASAEPAPSTMMVVSFCTFTWRAVPSISMVVSLMSMPRSEDTTVPPVRMAISSSISLRRSPKPGALMQHTFRVPRSLFTSRVDRASPSTSSATMSSFLPVCTTCSSRGSRSWMEEIFLSVSRMRASSSTASIFSVSVTI